DGNGAALMEERPDAKIRIHAVNLTGIDRTIRERGNAAERDALCRQRQGDRTAAATAAAACAGGCLEAAAIVPLNAELPVSTRLDVGVVADVTGGWRGRIAVADDSIPEIE